MSHQILGCQHLGCKQDDVVDVVQIFPATQVTDSSEVNALLTPPYLHGPISYTVQ